MKHVAAEIPDKWKLVAIGLGLSMAQIRDINQQQHGDSRLCFAEVFDHWQRQSTSQQPVNWATIMSVLQDQLVAEAVLANTIQKQFLEDS